MSDSFKSLLVHSFEGSLRYVSHFIKQSANNVIMETYRSDQSHYDKEKSSNEMLLHRRRIL